MEVLTLSLLLPWLLSLLPLLSLLSLLSLLLFWEVHQGS